MHAFSLIELIISIAIVAVISVAGIVSFSNTNREEALQLETGKVLSLLEKARAETLSGKSGIAYGVHFEESRAVLFSGSVYSSTDPRNTAQTLHPEIRISSISLAGGGSNVLFSRLSGATAQSGTVRLSARSNANASSTITIASTGVAY